MSCGHGTLGGIIMKFHNQDFNGLNHWPQLLTLGDMLISGLTHLPPDKMAAILQMIFQMHFCEWKVFIAIKISLKFVPKGPIDNNPALV